MVCTLPDIEEFCSTLSGLKSIKIYLPEDVQVMPSPVGCSLLSTALPTMKSGKSAKTIPIDAFSGGFTCRPATDKSGDYFQNTLNFSIRRNRRDVAEWLLRLKNRPVHLEIVDVNSVMVFVKNMRLAAELTIEPKLGGKNAFTFSFTSKALNPPVYIEIPPPPASGIGVMIIGSTFTIG